MADPGWSRFLAHVAREWCADSYARKMEQAISTTPVGPDMDGRIKDRVTQVMVAKREIEAIMRWPEERLAQLRTRPQMRGSARGGY